MLAFLWPLSIGAQEPMADLSGTWVLNKSLGTSQAGAEMEGRGGARGRGRDGMPSRGGGRGGRGGFGRGGADRPDADEMAGTRGLMQEVLGAPARFSIIQQAEMIRFVDADGRTRSYASTGVSEKHQLASGTVETRTRWDHSVLVMDIKISDRVSLTRKYAVDATLRRLKVTTQTPGGRGEQVAVYEDAMQR